MFIVDQKRKEMYTSANMSHGLGAPLPINREKSNLIYFPMDRGIAGGDTSPAAAVTPPRWLVVASIIVAVFAGAKV